MATKATETFQEKIFPTPKPTPTRRPPGKDKRLTDIRASAGRQNKQDHYTNVPTNKPAQWLKATQPGPTKMTPGRLKEVTKVGNIDLPKGTIVKSVTQKKMGNSECDEWDIELNVCMPWSTREFLDMAEKVRMPWRRQPIIPTRSLRVIVNALEMGIHEFDKKWDRSVEMLAKRAALLAIKEEKARQSLHPAVQRVSCSKRTKFMEELLQNIEHGKPYPDIAVTACIREGFPPRRRYA